MSTHQNREPLEATYALEVMAKNLHEMLAQRDDARADRNDALDREKAEQDRAVKAERDRDVLSGAVRDFADSIRQEQATNNRLRAEQRLSPDMVDDAMRERAAAVYGEVFHKFGPGAALDAALLAAFNAPTRPEGAQQLDPIIDAAIRGHSDITSPTVVHAIADALAEGGVRAPEVES